ncbi:calcium:proton antiporter [Roseococcus suduntuyensis]|uniref:Ca2+:H+ antiporter n=1 Tax=Roseococcus suduntuyensis TaxID=455361 RepID=A0A840ACU9_9PROT|nr:calcium:proton antiporter [Roseococcus suduntuyensis]MBB3899768.1 Ca2+:H+ antiporter [Roseococcus suduntuyensis]
MSHTSTEAHGLAHGAPHFTAMQQFGPLGVAWAVFLAMTLLGHDAHSHTGLGQSFIIVVVLFTTILWGAIGVMRHAEAVAHELGEPLGTLVLTLSAVTVEVALILSVMLVGDSEPTLARDTMFAVVMIIVNGLLGAALLLGGFRHRQQIYNLEGARSFLVVLTPLAICAMVLPNFTTSTPDATLSFAQAATLGVITLFLYGVFLALQTSRHRSFFAEAAAEVTGGHRGPAPEAPPTPRASRAKVVRHAFFLVLTIIPVALLAHDMAEALDRVDRALGVPVQMTGVIIAVLILAPEGMAALRAAWANHLQRSVNILLGSSLSTIGMTVPAVLLVGHFIGHDIVLGLDQAHMIMLVLTLVTAGLTFGTAKTDMLKGAVHLALFGIYLMLVLVP